MIALVSSVAAFARRILSIINLSLPVCQKPAEYPIKVLFEPEIFLEPESVPIPILYDPDIFPQKEFPPRAILPLPIVSPENAPFPLSIDTKRQFQYLHYSILL